MEKKVQAKPVPKPPEDKTIIEEEMLRNKIAEAEEKLKKIEQDRQQPKEQPKVEQQVEEPVTINEVLEQIIVNQHYLARQLDAIYGAIKQQEEQ